MRTGVGSSALVAAALLTAACDALSPDVVVGERIAAPPPASVPERVAPFIWEPADARPPPLESSVRVEYRRPDLNLRLVDVKGLPRTWVPGSARRLTVTVANDGAARSPSTSIRLSLITRAAWVEDVEVDTLIVSGIAPGEAHVIEAEVTLPDWIASASFAFEAHVDPDDVVVERSERDNVWFGQTIDVSRVVVTPARVDFGAVQLGCAEPTTLSVENRSPRRVILAGVEPPRGPHGEPFRVVGPRLPRTLSPAGEAGSRVDLEVIFAPSGVVEVQTQIRVTTSEHRSQPLAVPLTGSGELAPTTSERHQQWPGPKVDFLLVVDRGPGMDREIAELRDYVPIWLAALDAESMDYQIAVTSADVAGLGGALVGPVVTSEHQHRVERVRTRLDDLGSAPEAENTALEAVRRSLLNFGGWIRPEAGLSVVFSSHRDDASDGEVHDYVRVLAEAKPSPEDVVANAVIGDGSARCARHPPAPRLIEVVRALGGRLDPVCDYDTFDSLWTLPHRGFGLKRRFDLERAPQGQTLSVRLDGRLQPPTDLVGYEVWTFDRWAQQVTFAPNRAPAPDARVDFEYVPHCSR